MISPEGRYTDRLRVGEQRLHVLHLSRQAVEKITGAPLQKWAHWAQARWEKLFTDCEGVAREPAQTAEQPTAGSQ